MSANKDELERAYRRGYEDGHRDAIKSMGKPIGWVNKNPRHPEDWFSVAHRDGWQPVYLRPAAK